MQEKNIKKTHFQTVNSGFAWETGLELDKNGEFHI